MEGGDIFLDGFEASAEAHTTNVENIKGALLEKAYKLRKDKSD